MNILQSAFAGPRKSIGGVKRFATFGNANKQLNSLNGGLKKLGTYASTGAKYVDNFNQNIFPSNVGYNVSDVLHTVSNLSN